MISEKFPNPNPNPNPNRLRKIALCGGQNRKNGHSSLPEAPNAKPNTDSESASKNTSKKIGLKKFFIAPTQNIGDFRFLTRSLYYIGISTMDEMESKTLAI